MDKKAPNRKYRAVITIDANDIDSLSGALDHIQFWMTAHYDGMNNRTSISGGYSSSHHVEIIVDEEMTPEKYKQALEDYLKS